MNKIIITLALILTTSLSFAGNFSEVKPSTSLLNDEKSFEVAGLQACTGEADDEDAVEEFASAL